MKISELLNEAAPRKRATPQSAPTAPSAPSIDSAQDDDGENNAPVNAEREFKEDAASIGDGIYALSAWVYPDAWTGDGYSDMLMHRITTLASEINADIGDYEGIAEQTIADDRALEVVFYNSHTQSMFRLSASGARGSSSVQFVPSLVELQQSGAITNAQMPKLQNVERVVRTWCDAVPESSAVDDASGRPNTSAWRRAENTVIKMFKFVDPGVGGDDASSDPDSAEFWSGTSRREPEPENKKAAADFRQQYIQKMKAELAAKAAKKDAGPGREKRK